MNLNYIHINNNILIEFQETLDLNSLLESNKQLISNPELEYLDYQVLNLLKVKHFDITSYDIKVYLVLYKSTKNWNKNMKTAIVTSNNDLIIQFRNQMSKLNLKPDGFKFFKTIDEALNWCKTIKIQNQKY